MLQVDTPHGRRPPVFTADGCPPTFEEGTGPAARSERSAARDEFVRDRG
jgi:hypothetical protein